MATIIEMTEDGMDELSSHIEKMLTHGGRAMSCLEKLRKECCDDEDDDDRVDSRRRTHGKSMRRQSERHASEWDDEDDRDRGAYRGRYM